MNQLTNNQRKLAYFVGLLLLSIPIIWLGRPATVDSEGRRGGGGELAEQRARFDLGEASLGDVDPSSATMNLVLLGLRGVATNVLWMEASDAKERKDWATLQSTVDSIKLLQPHYEKVWDFQGWNLAYNVSAEWDNVEDRFYWVKQGGKFVMEGSRKNRISPTLAHKVGDIQGQKINNADEKHQYRRFFLKDPDVDRYGEGTDFEFNRGPGSTGDFDHHWLAAESWYRRANEIEAAGHRQSMMVTPIFRQGPARARMSYPAALMQEGRFDEQTRRAWETAYDVWTTEYGREGFASPVGPVPVFMEADDEDLRQLAEANDVPLERLRASIRQLQELTQYRFWRLRAKTEADPELMEARRSVEAGKQAFILGDLDESIARLREGLEQWRTVYAKYPAFQEEPDFLEDIVTAQVFLENAYDGLGEELPADVPLMSIWAGFPDVVSQARENFRDATTG